MIMGLDNLREVAVVYLNPPCNSSKAYSCARLAKCFGVSCLVFIFCVLLLPRQFSGQLKLNKRNTLAVNKILMPEKYPCKQCRHINACVWCKRDKQMYNDKWVLKSIQPFDCYAWSAITESDPV